MKKTAFKTFVCSFVFSLFILFVINGLFFYSPKAPLNELKIPEKNIALFFAHPPQSAASQLKPIKKIALNIPTKPSSLQASASAEQNPPPLTLPALTKQKKIPEQKVRDFIPLEIAGKSDIKKAEELVVAQAEIKDTPLNGVKSITDPDNNKDQGGWDTGNEDYTIKKSQKPLKKQLIAQQGTPSLKAITSITDSGNDTGGDYDTGNDDYSLDKEANEPKPLLLAQNEIKAPPQKAISSITDSGNDTGGDYDTGNDDYSLDKEAHKPKPLLLAQNEIKAPPQKAISSITDSGNDTGGDYDTGNDDYSGEQNLLIPLQKDFADAPANKNFNIAKTADINQIAMVSGNTPIGGMIKENKDIGNGIIHRDSEPQEASDTEETNWESMAEKKNQDSPWVAAKGTKFPKNNTVLQSEHYKDAENNAKIQAVLNTRNASQNSDNEIKLASDMVQNILIPIPADILNDENLTPQLESSKGSKIEDEVIRREQEKNNENIVAQQMKQEIAKDNNITMPDKSKAETKSGGLFKSITSIFSGKSSQDSVQEIGTADRGNSFMDRVAGRVGKAKSGNLPTKILPAEMRLAFQPNRAEISGTTLKWIQAFANKVISDHSVILEIRIDGASSYALQQKRLNLLHNILTNKGVDYSKINTVFTTREPNSFILRTVRVNSNIDRDVKESKEQAAYYQSW